jgi:CCR4-NOT transcription complex subunit 9
MNVHHESGSTTAEAAWAEENRRVLVWVAELLNGSSRETALMELSKKREQVPELAMIIWHSYGMSFEKKIFPEASNPTL